MSALREHYLSHVLSTVSCVGKSRIYRGATEQSTLAERGKSHEFIFCHLREPPYWMLFPVMVDTKLREGLMSSRIFVREQSTRIICTRHTPKNIYICHVQLGILYNLGFLVKA